MRQRLAIVAVVALVAIALWVLLYPPLFLIDPGEYERTNVTVHDADGTQLATVDVRIADTRDKRRVGLSRTDSLENGSGMLFVHSDADTYTYVMRDMAFPLDIVFADSNGTITTIHHAPPDGSSYDGYGKFVLEVPRGWANETGVTTGATVTIPPEVADG
jgi:uncharacterized membrane protein (UPF0127 family)